MRFKDGLGVKFNQNIFIESLQWTSPVLGTKGIPEHWRTAWSTSWILTMITNNSNSFWKHWMHSIRNPKWALQITHHILQESESFLSNRQPPIIFIMPLMFSNISLSFSCWRCFNKPGKLTLLLGHVRGEGCFLVCLFNQLGRKIVLSRSFSFSEFVGRLQRFPR